MTGSNEFAALRRLWRLPVESRLGRPADLDVDRVVAAALVLADRDGLGGVTLPKVADSLGVTKMALYRYVGSKDELYTLLADAALAPVPESGLSTDWRTALRAWAYANREIFRRHPWLARVPTPGPPAGPCAIGWMDLALQALRDTALDWSSKVGVITLVSGWVRESATLAQDFAVGRGDRRQSEVEQDYGRALAELVAPRRFPEAAKLFASSAFGPDPAAGDDVDFTFGLEIVLDGIAARIERSAEAQRGRTID